MSITWDINFFAVQIPGNRVEQRVQQLLQQAFSLLQKGHDQQAEQIGRNVLAQLPNQPDALNLLGLLCSRRGDLEQARMYFNKGLKKAPGHLHLLNSAGSVEKDLNELAKAEALFLKALKINPGYFYARQNLARVYQTQRKFNRARRLYEQVIQQQPNFADALANLANILEIQHQLDEARQFASRALKINPDQYIARLVLANIAQREQSYDEMIGLLLPLLESQKLSPVNRAVFGGKCAYAYEKKGDYSKAFMFYRDANQELYDLYEPSMRDPDPVYAPAAVERIASRISSFSFPGSVADIKSPVFLIGFPRSGTTLLDQILSSHSEITVLEEKSNLDDVLQRYPATDEGLSALEQAGEPELDKFRRAYWAGINREIGADRSHPVIIDKLPLNAVALLHISRLFPQAKIIAALRDPRDCVFSCYQQRFGMNPAMFQLLKLETAVAYYDRVMSVISQADLTGAFNMHFVRYEQVIENFDGEVKALTEFLGLEWEEGMRDYQATAKSRDISTPSAAQVIQPLYRSSIGKWKHYRNWIGAGFEPLEKWVKKWGYEPAN